MNARFRIRTNQGQELEPRTLEIFSELVRSGVVRPRDLVFDALTGEWVPAEAHPMVRLLQDPLVNDPLSPTLEPRLDLVEPAAPSPEEEARAFIRRMEEERRADPHVAPLARELDLTSARPGVDEMAAPAPEPAAAPVVAEGGAGPGPGRASAGSPPRRRRSTVVLPASVGLLAAAAVLALPSPRSGPDGEEAPVALAAAGAPASASAAEGAVREAAGSAFALRVEALRAAFGVGDPPPVWLEGRYLAHADSFPQVPAYWEGALAFVDTVEAREDALYREAYLEAAQGWGMAGPLRSLRLARALEDFAADRRRRSEVFERGREMARSALALHELLVGLGERVTHEPLRGGRVSADPVLEAAGADDEAQLLLETALDRVLLSLRGPDGASLRDRDRLGSWLAEALASSAGSRI